MALPRSRGINTGRGARDGGLSVQVGFAEASGHAASAVVPEMPLLPESGHFDVVRPGSPELGDRALLDRGSAVGG